MLTAPYSIYVNKRPVRVAFLIEDKPDSMAIIDAIMEYCRDRWGGRFCPIVITDGKTFSKEWWSLLEATDPDVVKSFVSLSESLLADLERRVSPYLILQPDAREQSNGYRSICLPDDCLSILPTPALMRSASGAAHQSCFVFFKTEHGITDPNVKRFAEWSFGGASLQTMAERCAREGLTNRFYSVTDVESLTNSLRQLSTYESFTYAIQLCSVPTDVLPEVEHNRFGNMFHVIIGDTPLDGVYFWNLPASIPQWRRSHLGQVWLPVCLATNAEFAKAFGSWLHRQADPNGSGQGGIRFISLSLTQERLQEVAKSITVDIHFCEVNALSAIQPPNVRAVELLPPNQGRMDLYRASSTVERLTLDVPEIEQKPIPGDAWMADVYIEFRPERYPMIHGRKLWWQLPRLNCLASQIFRRPSRILKSRYPSVLMKRGDTRLDVILADDMSVFRTLAADRNSPPFTIDARNEKTLPGRSPYDYATLSEKGRYLSGLLDLFGGLYPATDVLKERYWRRMFDLLSGRDAQIDAKRLEDLENNLKKLIRANGPEFYSEAEGMKWLAKKLFNFARGLRVSSRDLTLEDFRSEAEKHSHSDVVDELAQLTERSVMLMGIKAKCPSCGSRAWHHIDEAKQTLQCGGCRIAFAMPPEQVWHYRLNSLVRSAHAEHGLVPVVLVLGQLLGEAHSAFAFVPCLDLFEEYASPPIGDLDIAAIVDGKFVIGEIKQSRDLFNPKIFAKMEAIARRLMPDLLLFASMDIEPTQLINKEIARLSQDLRPLGIDVQWWQRHL